MLPKFLGSRNHNIPLHPNEGSIEEKVEKPSILKIIHAGGIVERHYMALPAACIMEKYPKFVLTRPEIFQRPLDSIVGPDEMLVPGQKYFVVPILTVKKLRQRMLNPTTKNKDAVSNKCVTGGKTKPGNRRVCFKGVGEMKSRRDSGGAVDDGDDDDKVKKNKKKSVVNGGRGLRNKKNVRFSPALTIINGRT